MQNLPFASHTAYENVYWAMPVTWLKLSRLGLDAGLDLKDDNVVKDNASRSVMISEKETLKT